MLAALEGGQTVLTQQPGFPALCLIPLGPPATPFPVPRYSDDSAASYAPLAQIALDASYEATLAAAALVAQRGEGSGQVARGGCTSCWPPYLSPAAAWLESHCFTWLFSPLRGRALAEVCVGRSR